MAYEGIIEENTKQREIQFRNFAAAAGLSEEIVIEAMKTRFAKPWPELTASQKRGRLLSEQFLACYNKTSDGKMKYQRVAWRSLFMPTEILYAMDLMPFTGEMAAAQLAMSGLSAARLETAEGNGFSPDLCSFIKTCAGATLEDIFPSPDIIFTTSHLCDPAAKFATYVSRKYGRPEFVLDIPYGVWGCGSQDIEMKKINEAVDYVASQIENMVEFITAHTGVKLEEARLREVIDWTNQARKWFKLGNDVTYNKGTIATVKRGSKDLDYAANLMQTWGTREIVDVYETRYHEFMACENAMRSSSKPRIVWGHLRPYYKNDIVDYIEEKADIVASQVNFIFWDELDPNDPFRSIARKTILNPAYCPLQYRIDLYIREIQRGDGIIAFYPKSCRHFHSGARMEAEALKKAGIPMLTIDGDCIDNRGDDFLVLKTRIDRFLKSLSAVHPIERGDAFKPASPPSGCELGDDK
jgi:benzoyl-CoA reductase/2-hydroxyglutaryl-CoA dehydratase subunit BcrC/BadD/HgdB